MIGYTVIDAPIGTRLHLAASPAGLCWLYFGGEESAVAAQIARHFGEVPTRDDARLAQASAALHEYFAGTLTAFDLPLDLRGTPFQRDVWSALCEIPYGETRSYRDIAARIGRPTAVRAVAAANARNPVAIVVPCHRVIGADGALRGYGGGLPIKQALLNLEAGHRGGGARWSQQTIIDLEEAGEDD
jgi:methylated-DNA-[protein]-cysteine S-methyltransferase